MEAPAEEVMSVNDGSSSSALALTTPMRDALEAQLIDSLVAHGLDVDAIEGDFRGVVSHGDARSKHLVLLLRGNDQALAAYGRRLKLETWLRSGSSREVESVVSSGAPESPAERIQVIDHIIREGAKVTADAAVVRSVFPVHDPEANKYLLKMFMKSLSLSGAFLGELKDHFGERVAYYFAFMDFYNKALVPIAVLGVLLSCFRGVLGTPMYMRLLVPWALLVSVGWSYGVLKTWSRRNNELHFAWENNLDTKAIVYQNPNFRGEPCVNPVTGMPDKAYASWKRYPKYVLVVSFMVLQIAIMMFVIAIWITTFEALLVRYPDSGMFSAQWFYILFGGILYGLFVDVIQWSVIVTKAARLFTEWENWKTVEQYERAYIRKVFFMDFLNYYTWFFLLAFVYVIPGAGDTITNFLNSLIWKDPANCCFGPYLDRSGQYCHTCPPSWHPLEGVRETRCIPCSGWVTFDINHLDLETLFLTPILVTQGLNLLIAVLIPWINRKHHEQRLKGSDRRAMQMAKERGERRLLAEMTYDGDRDGDQQLENKAKARLFENDDVEMERLNAKARAILLESDQEDYDSFEDYHHVIVQFGFVVMFSMLWPPMPVACLVINALKTRGDGFRMCHTLKRPLPRKAAGIGEWKMLLHFLAVTGIIVNIGLIFISTGAMEFYSRSCTQQISDALNDDFSRFRFGPDFACYSLTTRMVLILVSENLLLLGIWCFWKMVRSVPATLELETVKQEFAFKTQLYDRATQGSSANGSLHTSFTSVNGAAQHSAAPSPPPPKRKGALAALRQGLLGSKEERQPLLPATSKQLAQAWDASSPPTA